MRWSLFIFALLGNFARAQIATPSSAGNRVGNNVKTSSQGKGQGRTAVIRTKPILPPASTARINSFRGEKISQNALRRNQDYSEHPNRAPTPSLFSTNDPVNVDDFPDFAVPEDEYAADPVRTSPIETAREPAGADADVTWVFFALPTSGILTILAMYYLWTREDRKQSLTSPLLGGQNDMWVAPSDLIDLESLSKLPADGSKGVTAPAQGSPGFPPRQMEQQVSGLAATFMVQPQQDPKPEDGVNASDRLYELLQKYTSQQKKMKTNKRKIYIRSTSQDEDDEEGIISGFDKDVEDEEAPEPPPPVIRPDTPITYSTDIGRRASDIGQVLKGGGGTRRTKSLGVFDQQGRIPLLSELMKKLSEAEKQHISEIESLFEESEPRPKRPPGSVLEGPAAGSKGVVGDEILAPEPLARVSKSIRNKRPKSKADYPEAYKPRERNSSPQRSYDNEMPATKAEHPTDHDRFAQIYSVLSAMHIEEKEFHRFTSLYQKMQVMSGVIPEEIVTKKARDEPGASKPAPQQPPVQQVAKKRDPEVEVAAFDKFTAIVDNMKRLDTSAPPPSSTSRPATEKKQSTKDVPEEQSKAPSDETKTVRMTPELLAQLKKNHQNNQSSSNRNDQSSPTASAPTSATAQGPTFNAQAAPSNLGNVKAETPSASAPAQAPPKQATIKPVQPVQPTPIPAQPKQVAAIKPVQPVQPTAKAVAGQIGQAPSQENGAKPASSEKKEIVTMTPELLRGLQEARARQSSSKPEQLGQGTAASSKPNGTPAGQDSQQSAAGSKADGVSTKEAPPAGQDAQQTQTEESSQEAEAQGEQQARNRRERRKQQRIVKQEQQKKLKAQREALAKQKEAEEGGEAEQPKQATIKPVQPVQPTPIPAQPKQVAAIKPVQPVQPTAKAVAGQIGQAPSQENGAKPASSEKKEIVTMTPELLRGLQEARARQSSSKPEQLGQGTAASSKPNGTPAGQDSQQSAAGSKADGVSTKEAPPAGQDAQQTQTEESSQEAEAQGEQQARNRRERRKQQRIVKQEQQKKEKEAQVRKQEEAEEMFVFLPDDESPDDDTDGPHVVAMKKVGTLYAPTTSSYHKESQKKSKFNKNFEPKGSPMDVKNKLINQQITKANNSKNEEAIAMAKHLGVELPEGEAEVSIEKLIEIQNKARELAEVCAEEDSGDDDPGKKRRKRKKPKKKKQKGIQDESDVEEIVVEDTVVDASDAEDAGEGDDDDDDDDDDDGEIYVLLPKSTGKGKGKNGSKGGRPVIPDQETAMKNGLKLCFDGKFEDEY